MYIPKGFGTVTPQVFVNGADKFSDFIVKAFNGVEKGRTTRPDGVIANLQMDVSDMPYGDRQGGVKDPFGNIWWISQRLVDGPYE